MVCLPSGKKTSSIEVACVSNTRGYLTNSPVFSPLSFFSICGVRERLGLDVRGDASAVETSMTQSIEDGAGYLYIS